MPKAFELANTIARNSPDSIIASRAIMNLSMDKVLPFLAPFGIRMC